jgi:hypothetical protein
VVAPPFPFVEVSLVLEDPGHASRFRRGEPRGRHELARAEEGAQSHGSTDGGEDRVHLRAAHGGSVVSRRDRLGYGDAKIATSRRTSTRARPASSFASRVASSFRCPRRRRVARTSGRNQRWANVALMALAARRALTPRRARTRDYNVIEEDETA